MKNNNTVSVVPLISTDEALMQFVKYNPFLKTYVASDDPGIDPGVEVKMRKFLGKIYIISQKFLDDK